MARREQERGHGPRGDRWTERLDQWHQGRNAKYQAQGWEPDTERDSSLGEYYPADEFYEYPGGSFQGSDFTGGGQPRPLASNRESGYQDNYRQENPNRSRRDYDRERQEARRRHESQYARRGEQGRQYRPPHPEEQGQFYDPGYGAGDWHGQEDYGSDLNDHYRGDHAASINRTHEYRGSEAYRDWAGSNASANEQRPPVNHRGKGPKGYQRSDQRIREDICERLSDEPVIDASEISIEVSEGRVTLEGHVYSRSMKHRTEDIVADCTGVKDIDNRLRLLGGPGAAGSWSSREEKAESNQQTSHVESPGPNSEGSRVGHRPQEQE